ncbi:MAG: hypothetical protein Q8L81_17970 [Bacteroidota bacterium]|nr:hypothetical protein [Bacteroidota bacterium]
MLKKSSDIQKNNLLSDNTQGTDDFNLVQTELQKDMERIEKMFLVVNALCDVFIGKPEKEMNKWANSQLDEHTKRINNSFLL